MINLDISKALLWGLGGLTLAGLALWGYLYVTGLQDDVVRLEARVGQVTSEREEARRIAQANADAAEAIRRDAARDLAAVQDDLATERQRRVQFTEIREEVRNVPVAAQSCPVDPAVLRALERLRHRSAADGNGGQVHPTAGAGTAP